MKLGSFGLALGAEKNDVSLFASLTTALALALTGSFLTTTLGAGDDERACFFAGGASRDVAESVCFRFRCLESASAHKNVFSCVFPWAPSRLCGFDGDEKGVPSCPSKPSSSSCCFEIISRHCDSRFCATLLIAASPHGQLRRTPLDTILIPIDQVDPAAVRARLCRLRSDAALRSHFDVSETHSPFDGGLFEMCLISRPIWVALSSSTVNFSRLTTCDVQVRKRFQVTWCVGVRAPSGLQ